MTDCLACPHTQQSPRPGRCTSHPRPVCATARVRPSSSGVHGGGPWVAEQVWQCVTIVCLCQGVAVCGHYVLPLPRCGYFRVEWRWTLGLSTGVAVCEVFFLLLCASARVWQKSRRRYCMEVDLECSVLTGCDHCVPVPECGKNC